MRTKETLNKGTKVQEKKNQTLIKTGFKKKIKKKTTTTTATTTQHVVMPMCNLHKSIFILHLSNSPPSFLPILGEKTFW